MRHYILILLSVFVFQDMYSQISMKDCKSTSQNTIRAIESNNLDLALEYFEKNNQDAKSQIEMAIKEVRAIKHMTALKFIDAKSKEYVVNRCTYMSSTGEVYLSVNFYYKIKNKKTSISKIEIQNKSHFISLEELKKRKRNKGSVPPPSNQGLN